MTARPTRFLPAQSERVETGPTKFGDDWTGMFIRGDDCFRLASMLRSALRGNFVVDLESAVLDVASMLEQADEHGPRSQR